MKPSYDTREEFLDAIEELYEICLKMDEPFYVSAFGSYETGLTEADRAEMRGGLMFGVFRPAPDYETITSIRTTCPIPDAFKLGEQIRYRLRNAKKIVQYQYKEMGVTHILTVSKPNGSPWECGIIATDAEAIELFLKYDGISLRRI